MDFKNKMATQVKKIPELDIMKDTVPNSVSEIGE